MVETDPLLEDVSRALEALYREFERGRRELSIEEISRLIERDPLRTRVVVSLLVSRGYLEEVRGGGESLCLLCQRCPLRRLCPLAKIASLNRPRLYRLSERALSRKSGRRESVTPE